MFAKKLIGDEEERAVSPVIGVILMVAITVILAAVIAAFVLDIGPGETDPSATFDADVDSEGDEVEVTLNSLGSGTDGIVVVEDINDDDEEGGFDGDALSVSGDSTTYDGSGLGSDSALIAFSADEDIEEGDDFDADLNNYAIIDNLDDLE